VNQQLEPVHHRQSAIDDHHVVLPGQAEVQAPLPVAGHVDRVALIAQRAGEHLSEFGVVLDQQQSVRIRTGGRHGSKLPQLGPASSRLSAAAILDSSL
jgi:hypothetical protein